MTVVETKLIHQLSNPGPRCMSCPQLTRGVKRIEVEIDPANYCGIMLVGESPWRDEVMEGRPFAGASRFILERWLRKAGLASREVAITNALWCKPPAPDWFSSPESLEALSHCHGYLEDAIAQYKPRAIVALGAVALKRLAGVSGLVDRRTPRMGYIHSSQYGPVVAAPHPSYIIRGNPAMEPYALLALQRARELAGHGQPPQPPENFPHLWLNEVPPLPDAVSTLMLDIETNEIEPEDQRGGTGVIVRIGLAWRGLDGITACSLAWNGYTKEIAGRLITRAERTAFWNQTFDKPRLQAEGLGFGSTVDAMLVWHFLQPNLPKALGAAAPFFWRGQPWKHMDKENPALYNALDAYQQLAILEGSTRTLGDRYHHFANGPLRVLDVLEHGSDRGIMVSIETRETLRSEVATQLAEAQTHLDEIVPVEIRPLKTWKRKPAKHPEAIEMELPGGGQGWGIRLPFLPNSPKQVLTLATHLGIKLPDTNEKTLARFPHAAFQHIVKMRKLNDTISNFLMHPTMDGAVHPRFSYFPETWRKSCREPNLQSLPARHPLAKLIRGQLVARPGHVFIAADSAAIEAVLVGWLAISPRYMRLAKAGVHGWLASKLMGEPISLTDPELLVKCKASKKRWPEAYDRCKRIVHGSNYGMTPQGIMLNYPGLFETLAEAKKLQQFYLESEAGRDIVVWQRRTVELAHRQGWLETPWGVRNYYQRALIFDPVVRAWKHGEQAKEAIAFMPQSMASSLQDRYILTLPEWLQSAIRLVRHDEILCEVPEARMTEGLEALETTMRQPIPELDGLTIDVESKTGRDLNLEGL